MYLIALGFSILFNILLIDCSRDWTNDIKRETWNQYSREKIGKIINRKLNGNVAKNIILFLGDGMGISTVTAGRIRKGQMKGNTGEEEITNMESLDHLALSKTYNINAQTADSAGTATAYFSGVKTRLGAIGVDGRAIDCPTSLDAKLESILKWAHFAGKSTGIVTTTRLTHATPSAIYANIYFREMEAYDGIKFKDEHKNQGCKDIAAQFVDENSLKVNLVFAGGRNKFLSNRDKDFDTDNYGHRIDNRNLINDWNEIMKNKNLKHKFLWNITDFYDLRPNQYDHIFGLLNYDHMDYETERVETNPPKEPSLVEMTTKAIELLSTNPNGFFLLVEGGKIDHAHHNGNAKRALNDFVVFDDSIGAALKITSTENTLIITTADHSHVFTMGGYANRGNPILGINHNTHSNVSGLNLTYTPLNYGNGPGGLRSIRKTNLTNEITSHKDYKQEAAVYLKSETHGGEDVAIFASGPMSYLFDGTVEQSHIAHVMAYSACIGPYNSTNYPNCAKIRGSLTFSSNSSSRTVKINNAILMILCFVARYL